MKKKKVNHILWIIFMSALTVFMLIPIIMIDHNGSQAHRGNTFRGVSPFASELYLE
ncbi:hypothetical protein LC724_33970 [Blautia sp. RD014234]|nr:hypothetical protein [Blautia parvula]